jgi:microcin C transport system ATP-binding protein
MKMTTSKLPILSIEGLSVTFAQGDNVTKAVRNISFDIQKGKTTALVGESGSGKSVTALSLLKLTPAASSTTTGSIHYQGKNLLTFAEQKLQKIRGNKISMIFQEPMTSLNPLHRIVNQIGEAIDLHQKIGNTRKEKRVDELLELVGLSDIPKTKKAYPHELSGGQRQRVMIAMALANNPDLLIADEPTTALDVTIQKQVLELLKKLQKKFNMAILLISHDMSVVEHMADDILVMKEGEIVERNDKTTLLKKPTHPYTKKLLSSKPKGKANPVRPASKILLRAKDVCVNYESKSGFLGWKSSQFAAVKNATLSLQESETLGIVGESGSGKTSLGFALLRLLKSTGQIFFDEKPIFHLTQKELRPLRQDMQIVFQDPYGSLSPRMTIENIIEEGLRVHAAYLNKHEKRRAVEKVLKDVQIPLDALNRYPHEFSGGQRQRIAIARALILKPKLIILDEPTSALDLTIQDQILTLFKELQVKYGLSYIFISHDLSVVKSIANRVIVMKEGEIVEEGPTDIVFKRPQNTYTQNLISSIL